LKHFYVMNTLKYTASLTTTLNDSDFVNIIQPTQTNKLPLWPFWDKNHLIGLKIYSQSKTKKTPLFCLKRIKGKQSRKITTIKYSHLLNPK